MKEDLILTLYSKPHTVFTLKEASLFFPEIAYENLRSRMRYFVNVGKLKRLRQGVYAKNEFHPLEAANKLYRPSYVSLETVLAKEGVVFQYYETIFLASYLTRAVKLYDINIQYRRIKGDILTNPLGVEEKEGYFIATLERAFLDAVFIYKDYHFDNLAAIDWGKVAELKEIYGSKAFEKRLRQYHKLYQEEYVKH